MATFLFAWNPNKWKWDNLDKALDQVEATGYTLEMWSCRAYKSIGPGDRAFLVRLGVEPKGIMGAGYVLTTPFLAPHWSGDSKLVHRVDIEFDTLLNPSSNQLLPLGSLKKPPLDSQTWTPQSSGISISDEVASELEGIWFFHIESLGFSQVNIPTASAMRPHYEGASTRVSTTRYERNPHARRLCIQHYGLDCSVCGIDFNTVYGELGAGFIHVHHLEPISQNKNYKAVDPIRDLRPVCPNCHAMLHRKSPPLSIESLRELLE
ncbi:MAG: HNH endonuclease [Chloroflexi bacterium]|nr:HNH endonuclease [Chloroflexota bacterium]